MVKKIIVSAVIFLFGIGSVNFALGATAKCKVTSSKDGAVTLVCSNLSGELKKGDMVKVKTVEE